MKFTVFEAFILTLPSFIRSLTPIGNFAKVALKAIKEPRSRSLVLPKVTLPNESILPTNNLEAWSQPDPVDGENVLFAFLEEAFSKANVIVGKPKNFNEVKGLFESIQQFYLEKMVSKPVAEGYLYFGTGKNVETLALLLKHNPYFVSALQSDGSDGFRLSSTGDSWYSKILSVTSNDANMRRIIKDGSFDSHLRLKDGSNYEESEDIAGQLLFALNYYAQNIHALLHVFHYVNVLAIGNAAVAFPILGRWADKYIANVGVKYLEVQELLWPDQPYGALTGKLGAERANLLNILTEILTEWGNFKTAEEFRSRFIFRGINQAQRESLLPEFSKHVKIIPEFASDLDKAFAQSSTTSRCYDKANTAIEIFFKNVGDWMPSGNIFSISDIKTWIELMSVTGLLHGSTISFTRHSLTYQYISCKSDKDQLFSIADSVALVISGGTMLGLTKEKHVFASKIYDDYSLLKPPLPEAVRKVLDEYYTRSNDLKIKFYFEQQKNRPFFLAAGWILYDYFPDVLDGKQLTLSSYI